MFGLPSNGFFPCDAEPGEILFNGRREFRLATGPIDVLDAQQKPTVALFCELEIQQRRIGMSELTVYEVSLPPTLSR